MVGTYLLIAASLGVRRPAKIHKPFDFGNRRVIPPYFVAKIMNIPRDATRPASPIVARQVSYLRPAFRENTIWCGLNMGDWPHEIVTKSIWCALNGVDYAACEIKFSKSAIKPDVVGEMRQKLEKLQLPRKFSVRPVLIHVNGVHSEVVRSQFFSQIVDFGELLTA
jgi:hypothetical protein